MNLKALVLCGSFLACPLLAAGTKKKEEVIVPVPVPVPQGAGDGFGGPAYGGPGYGGPGGGTGVGGNAVGGDGVGGSSSVSVRGGGVFGGCPSWLPHCGSPQIETSSAGDGYGGPAYGGPGYGGPHGGDGIGGNALGGDGVGGDAAASAKRPGFRGNIFGLGKVSDGAEAGDGYGGPGYGGPGYGGPGGGTGVGGDGLGGNGFGGDAKNKATRLRGSFGRFGFTGKKKSTDVAEAGDGFGGPGYGGPGYGGPDGGDGIGGNGLGGDGLGGDVKSKKKNTGRFPRPAFGGRFGRNFRGRRLQTAGDENEEEEVTSPSTSPDVIPPLEADVIEPISAPPLTTGPSFSSSSAETNTVGESPSSSSDSPSLLSGLLNRLSLGGEGSRIGNFLSDLREDEQEEEKDINQEDVVESLPGSLTDTTDSGAPQVQPEQTQTDIVPPQIVSASSSSPSPQVAPFGFPAPFYPLPPWMLPPQQQSQAFYGY
mmetsp:Transcript_25362/g.49544  ORF Transcript_25362/g.49544 Transcript_25362/m.49544 type:complete len:481 (+) Transcript_25362:205-1647(+)